MHLLTYLLWQRIVSNLTMERNSEYKVVFDIANVHLQQIIAYDPINAQLEYKLTLKASDLRDDRI